MGRALYREYRPTSLDTVIGQDHITTTLKNAIKKGAISHAYLFTGPRGVGKTSVARILAHEINNIPYNEEVTQLDIIEIDAASNRRIDEIRDLRDKVHIAPTSCKYKVYIVDEVHMLTREAFNALLKTLEEPPAHVVFILATTESHKVPDTIISRTQRFSFKPIGTTEVAKQLRVIADKESINISDEALKLIAEYGNGSFRDSISMLDQIAGFSSTEITAENIGTLLGSPDEKILNNIIKSLINNDVEDMFNQIQQLREKGTNPSKTAQTLIRILRNNLLNDSSVLDSKTSVTLMKSLLPLTGTNSSFEAIEIALLDIVKFENQIIETTETQVTEEIETKPIIELETTNVSPEPEIQVKISEDRLRETIASKDESKNSWNDVLNALKTDHNTLYGVLRMAETKVEKDKIILVFQFEFHKKQLHQSKNIATLKSIVDSKLGKGYTIESEVVKKPIDKPKEKANSGTDEALSSVSNIFGGAELLES